ncbi:hypothetical protein T440DRAFT_307969 [Plenodomus tracheiphilus IPT5]|uniref:Uncharacterized protein n=1 Tax=Plenodomus tracheiphilus IPT5 TaxID=1408161 RepID=A0A6A7BDU5_9PLEO|nr:hypothetical protein T440DRAFT_307969 [Plenodomus tracheiphilus IPT5]
MDSLVIHADVSEPHTVALCSPRRHHQPHLDQLITQDWTWQRCRTGSTRGIKPPPCTSVLLTLRNGAKLCREKDLAFGGLPLRLQGVLMNMIPRFRFDTRRPSKCRKSMRTNVLALLCMSWPQCRLRCFYMNRCPAASPARFGSVCRYQSSHGILHHSFGILALFRAGLDMGNFFSGCLVVCLA